MLDEFDKEIIEISKEAKEIVNIFELCLDYEKAITDLNNLALRHRMLKLILEKSEPYDDVDRTLLTLQYFDIANGLIDIMINTIVERSIR